MAYLLKKDTADALKRLIGRESSSGVGGKVKQVGGGGQGSPIRYFVLAEDAVELPVYAWPGLYNDESGAITPQPDSELFELYYWLQILSSPKQAKAGYAGIYGRAEGLSVFINGPCINSCQTTSSITPGTPDNGEVDVPYTHTIAISGLDVDGVSAAGLPPGLTIDSATGEITGTPTTAGTYWVTLTGDSDDSPPCPITRITKIVIEEAGPVVEPPEDGMSVMQVGTSFRVFGEPTAGVGSMQVGITFRVSIEGYIPPEII